MKKITILIGLMIYSLGFAQTPEGTWKFTPGAGSFIVSSGEGATGTVHWQNGLAEVSGRSCLFDDEYVFNTDLSFQNIMQGSTWLEPWQGVSEGCGAPIAPHDNSNAATWAYSSANGTLTITGVGAFVGLNKAINGAELASLTNTVPASRTYKVAALTETTMTLDIQVGGNWWRFNFTKKLVGQPVIESLMIPSQTLGDIPHEITNPISNSPGAFSYTSSNTAVATVTGNTLFAVGPGKTTITATQAASAPYLTGEVSAEIIVYEMPITTAASTPPARNAGDVISIYSGAYTDLVGTNISQIWGQTTVVDVISPEDNATKRMVFFNYQGVIPAATMNVTGYKLHIDIYKTDMTAIEIALINPTTPPTEKAVTLTPTVVGWNSFDIDVDATNFPGIDLTNVFQMKLSAVPFAWPVGTETTYWDNLYFWKGTALGVSSFEKSNLKMYPNPVKNSLTIDANSAINRVSVYNVLGQEVMKASPKSNSVTLQTNELQKGVYMITTEIDGKISTSKVVKE